MRLHIPKTVHINLNGSFKTVCASSVIRHSRIKSSRCQIRHHQTKDSRCPVNAATSPSGRHRKIPSAWHAAIAPLAKNSQHLPLDLRHSIRSRPSCPTCRRRPRIDCRCLPIQPTAAIRCTATFVRSVGCGSIKAHASLMELREALWRSRLAVWKVWSGKT